MENSFSLHGSHGTTVEKSKSIQEKGFEKSKGRFGDGIYFWCESPYAEYLAKSWWRFCVFDGRYAGGECNDCAIVWADIEINENEFLDLDQKDIKYNLATLCLKCGIGYEAKNREIASIITTFLSMLEEELDCKFKVIETSTAMNKKFMEQYPISIIGAPGCYVVFDKRCIMINDITNCNDIS